MAESSETVSLQEPYLQKQYHHALDPISLLLSQNLNSGGCYYIMERGPRYRAYAELRESKLRRRRKQSSRGDEENNDPKDPKLTPPKKQVKFQVVMGNSTKGSSSILAQSVPDFSSALRKENRKPIELTPPPPQSKAWSRSNLAGSNAKGSKSANAGEKKGGLMAGRKSCLSLEELKGFSSAAGNAINGGDDRGGIIRGRVTGRNVFGFRKL